MLEAVPDVMCPTMRPLRPRRGLTTLAGRRSFLKKRFADGRDGAPAYFAWDGLNPLVEKDATGATVKSHTHGAAAIAGIGSVVVTRRKSGETDLYQYPHYDHRGSLFELTGDEALSAEYNAFGEELERSGAAVTRFVLLPPVTHDRGSRTEERGRRTRQE